ncbi:DUF4326 domain-containing protein [Inquilinus sp. CA228]|uniref:DUF4326 domain-containing protein n=1 Tax=Inquilinus sp. CA228 TaxID=3455609 RepID=UPI003F8D042A
MTGRPKRVQLRRTKGWRLPPGTVVCGRGNGNRWGNPWRVTYEPGNGWCVLDPDWVARPRRHFCSSRAVAHRFAVWRYRRWAQSPLSWPARNTAELRGRDLACWCGAELACHVDVLLELANGPQVTA